MAKKGPRLHLKRIAAPKIYPIPRKEYKWTVAPHPGAHKKEMSVPLLIIVRDLLKLANTAREARRIIGQGKILVDGRPRKDYKYPVGLFDIVEIPEIEETYRVLFARNLKYRLVKIDEKEKYLKPLKLLDKRYVKGGLMQLNLFSGRNILVDPESEYGKLKTQNALLVNVYPQQKIEKILPLEEGSWIYIMWGRLVGCIGKLKAIERPSVFVKPQVVFEDHEGNERRTIIDYVVPLGKEEPVINIPSEIYELKEE